MWVSLILLIVLLAVVLKQGTQGLFNAFITTMLAVCCSAIAFGTYEWVANHWVVSVWPTEKASLPRDLMLPLTLALLFGVPVLALRLVFDRLTPRPIPVYGLLDRVGAGVCGTVTGLIMMGILAACIQMIPFGETFLGYSYVTGAVPSSARNPTDEPPAHDQGNDLLFGATRFAPGMASVLSSGVFSGSRSFFEDHPDLIESLGWVGSVHRAVSRYAPPKSIQIVRHEPVDTVYQFVPANAQANEPQSYGPIKPDPGREFLMVRVQLNREARDAANSFAFSLRQFRLVGRVDGEAAHRQFAPIAIQQEDESDPTNRHVKVTKRGGKFWPATADVLTPRNDNNNQVEIVFEVLTGFKPAFVEYKHEARAAFSADPAATAAGSHPRRPVEPDTSAAPAAPTQPGYPPAPGAAQPPPGRRPRAQTVTTDVTTGRPSQFSDELPMPLRAYDQGNAEIAGDALNAGHLSGEVAAQANGTRPPVAKFGVPPDKRLLQLSVSRLRSASTLGQAMSRAIEVLQTYRVMDDRGQEYPLVGKWAKATTRQREWIEVQYFPPPAGSIGGLGAFRAIRESQLTPQDDFVLLFLVDPGVTIVSFTSGGGGPGAGEDLKGQNLTAPP